MISVVELGFEFIHQATKTIWKVSHLSKNILIKLIIVILHPFWFLHDSFEFHLFGKSCADFGVVWDLKMTDWNFLLGLELKGTKQRPFVVF